MTVPISVHGFSFTSFQDLFWTTTSISDFPGLNSEVFPGTNKFTHLGDDSTST